MKYIIQDWKTAFLMGGDGNYYTSDYIFNSENIVKQDASAENKKKFVGYHIDAGATRSIIGAPQLQAYAKQYNLKIHPNPTEGSFLLGTVVHQSLGTFQAGIPLPDNSFM